MPAARAAGEASITHIAQLMGIWGVCASLLHGVLIGLLVWAAFAGRPKARAVPPPMA
jgi:predicted membrane protein